MSDRLDAELYDRPTTNERRIADLMAFLRGEASKVMNATEIVELKIVEQPERHVLDVFAYRSDHERIHVGTYTMDQIVRRGR